MLPDAAASVDGDGWMVGSEFASHWTLRAVGLEMRSVCGVLGGCMGLKGLDVELELGTVGTELKELVELLGKTDALGWETKFTFGTCTIVGMAGVVDVGKTDALLRELESAFDTCTIVGMAGVVDVGKTDALLRELESAFGTCTLVGMAGIVEVFEVESKASCMLAGKICEIDLVEAYVVDIDNGGSTVDVVLNRKALLVIFCDVTDVVAEDACWSWAVVDGSEEISEFEVTAELANATFLSDVALVSILALQ